MASAAPAQTPEALAGEVAAQNALVNELRKTQGDGPAVEEAKKRLGELKKALALLQHAAGGGAREKKKERMLLKTAKVRPVPRGSCAPPSCSSRKAIFPHAHISPAPAPPVSVCVAGAGAL